MVNQLRLENPGVLAPHTVNEEEEVKTKGFRFITSRKFMELKSCEGELESSPFHCFRWMNQWKRIEMISPPLKLIYEFTCIRYNAFLYIFFLFPVSTSIHSIPRIETILLFFHPQFFFFF